MDRAVGFGPASPGSTPTASIILFQKINGLKPCPQKTAPKCHFLGDKSLLESFKSYKSFMKEKQVQVEVKIKINKPKRPNF